jgi:hypothetical protein
MKYYLLISLAEGPLHLLQALYPLLQLAADALQRV